MAYKKLECRAPNEYECTLDGKLFEVCFYKHAGFSIVLLNEAREVLLYLGESIQFDDDEINFHTYKEFMNGQIIKLISGVIAELIMFGNSGDVNGHLQSRGNILHWKK